MKKLSTEFRLLAGLMFGLALLLSAGWQLYRSLQDYRENSLWVAHTYQVLDQLYEVKSGVLELESIQRLYFITGDDVFTGQRDSKSAQIRQAEKKIAELTADNPRQQLIYKNLQLKLNERLNALDRTLQIYQTEGYPATRKHLISGTPRLIMEALMVQISNMEEEERVLLQQRKIQVENNFVQARNIGILVLIITLAGGALLWWQFRRDVIQRSLAEAAVRDSESLLKQILDILPVGVLICDREGSLTTINPGAKLIWGGSRQVNLDQYGEYAGWWPDSGKRIASDEWALARTMKTGETILAELADIRCFDGNRKTIANSTAPLRDDKGNIIGGLSVNVDVTDFTATERKLRAAAHYDDTQAKAQILFTASFERNKIFASLLSLLAERHGYQMSALYSFDEWYARFRCEASHGLARDIPREFELGEGLLGQAALTGKSNSLDVSRLSMQTGLADFSPRHVFMIPVVYQEHRLAVMVLATTNTVVAGEQAFLERLAGQLAVALHNLRQYNDLKMLADQLRTSSDEIAAKNQQLEQASRMKSEFLANMSHELRTPLNAIVGFSEILKDGLMGNLLPQQKDAAADIFHSGKHLLALINDILDLSKIEAGKMQVNLESTDIASLLQASLQVIREQASLQNLQVSAKIPEDLGNVWLDEVKLKQIVYNLLSNAVKFTPEGGRVHLSARRIEGYQVAGGRFEHYLEIMVSDSGIGISPESQAELFQPFTQIDNSLSRKHQGTGLGLAMVKRIAELHEGSVSMSSIVGKGSTFTVLLPWRTAHLPGKFTAAQPAPVTSTASSLGNGELLALVIEDDDQAAEVLRVQLESEGFRILRATTAEAALGMAEEAHPDLITLDILLPGMDGWEFLERFKQHPLFASTPVVIISIVADRGRGLSLGAAHVMQKPIARENLTAALSALGFCNDPATDNKTALIVDDDPKAVKLVSTQLDSFGYQTLSALGGQDGINMARQHKPDLIVLDLMMPEINGFDVVEALKNDTVTASIPIIVLTAKQITPEDRLRLNGDVKKVMEKSDFNHGRFIGEVRRAMTGRGK
ncbi:response regulator [Undibacterium pigrum]|uniref:Virulence sensor protein BvgS n=1 Tax=Undibacterium pigrum TaxID=401470 RepID=A0A318JWH4_9BURK|nr:response regulator [Undibacterium pigrum]PXX45065.1 PAS domain S-box-containing protein [Undibacterium pigrum]